MSTLTWFNPDEVKPFEPTDRQEAFRLIATLQCEEGNIWKKEWIRASRSDDAFQESPMTLREWREWNELPGFAIWFYSDIEDVLGPDDKEMAMLDARFWHGVAKNMHKDREWAYKLYAKVRWGDKNATAASESRELHQFIGDESTAQAWHAAEA